MAVRMRWITLSGAQAPETFVDAFSQVIELPKAPDLWQSLRGTVKRVVNEMPLWKLQTVGNERMDFLYANLDTTTTTITLKLGVAYCFRAFYGLMRDLIQGAWVRFVQKLNAVKANGIIPEWANVQCFVVHCPFEIRPI